MELQLKNIGMIKEATVKLDGLTVIAGENDTGKSTFGKSLFMALYFIYKLSYKTKEKYISSEIIFSSKIPKFIFASQIFNAEITFTYKNKIKFYIDLDSYLKTKYKDFALEKAFLPILVETPLVWSFTDLFRDIAQIESQMNIRLEYPFLMKDLNFKMHIKSASQNASNKLDIKDVITSLIGGKFKKDEIGRYYFDKKGQKIELVNTATGIKYLGIFQILYQNNYLNKDTVLILDEPEVHLHPKWQLEMAKIITELVKSGVKVLVTSHSPYIIQALIKYARDKNIVDKTNFYLSQKVDDYAMIENVNDELNRIFELLAEPMNEVFEL